MQHLIIRRSILCLLCSFLISGCISTLNESEQDESINKRASLSELADEQSDIQLDKFKHDKAVRTAKLAGIYQQLLTLEPDPEVRTKVEYRLVQINTETFENQAFGGKYSDDEELTLAQLKNDDQALNELVLSYKKLIKNYPKHNANEHIRYQLAKALDLQGSVDESLVEMELLLIQYPASQYLAELNFRRGEIYYNLQNYTASLNAYAQVVSAANNDNYLVNSIYMSGWSLFKMNRLPEADAEFLNVLDAIIAAEKQRPYRDEFSFTTLHERYQNLAIDTQRVLSVSLSQQAQSATLVNLVNKHQSSKYLHLYEHVLFENLANFLIKKELKSDAELTYKAYLKLARGNIWSARFSLALLNIYRRDGKFSSMYQLKNNYVIEYGLKGTFWHNASLSLQDELLPHLLNFSDEHGRRLYAYAQEQENDNVRVGAFSEAAEALATYLDLAKLPNAKTLLNKDILHDEYLYAEANFEALQYTKAIENYEHIAYFTRSASLEAERLKLESAYATTFTIRALLKSISPTEHKDIYQKHISERMRLDKLFIKQYPNDVRALQLATHVAQYSFDVKDYKSVKSMRDFVFNTYKVIQLSANKKSYAIVKDLSPSALKQVQIVSQLSAHSLYQQKRYTLAEKAYVLALDYADRKINTWQEMRNLLASSIYFQADIYKTKQPKTAVFHLLRISKVVPESNYRVTAEFDAANLLLEQKIWQQAIEVLLNIQQNFPNYEYTASIPAKLASSYEATEQWQLAAEQLLIMVAKEEALLNSGKAAQVKATELMREAQYTAAEYYLKAGNTAKALITFRSYAHTYPQPFNVAQEVRFKMSEFYQESNEPNKQYYWFRKILSFHGKQKKASTIALQPRAVELASLAALGLGKAHQQTFKWIKLNTPLQKSLKRKQSSMKTAIKYYQKVLGFQLAQYVPKATFNLAEMYRQLADDVMKSQRPKDLEALALEEYEILLEELAYPFEEKAIEIHLSNSQRAWQNIYDQWIEKSFATLAEIAPALYNKQERSHDAIQDMH